MNALRFSLALLIGIVVGLAIGFLIPSTSSAPAVTVSIAHEYDYSDAYTVDAAYPVFGIPVADSAVKSAVDGAVTDFKQNPANPGNDPQNEFQSIFDYAYVGSDIVSTELVFSEFTGGAHPNAQMVGINVDRKTGKELTLTDALGLIGMDLGQVASSSETQLKAQLGDAYIFPDGVQATSDNYSSFIVGTSTVSFVFQEYQVAPYSSGVQMTVFPRVR